MHFEEILDNIGVFGRFQKRLYLPICLQSFGAGMITLSYVILAGTSDHWCSTPDLDLVNCTQWSLDKEECMEAKKSAAIPLSNSDEYESCIQYNLTGIEPEEWYPGWVTSDVTNDTMACDAGWTYDTSRFKATIITDFDLVCEKRDLADLSQSIFFEGVLIGSAILGALSDRIGRQRIIITAITLGAICIVMTALSNSYIMFVILRALFGATFFSTNVVAFTLKFVSPSWRTFVGNLSNFFWAGGYMFVAGLGYFIRGWRMLVFVMSSFPLIVVLLLPLVSESPRWLITKGRLDDAEKVIRRVAKVNKKDLPEEFFDGLGLKDHQNILDKKPIEQGTLVDLFRNRNLRFKMIILLFLWFITTLVYFGLSQSTGDLGVDFYVSFFVSGAVEVPAYTYVMFALDWFGRKPNLSGSMVFGGIACLVSVFLPSGVWKTAVAMFGKFCITITFAIMFIFTTEQFPTPVRNVGLGMCSSFGRLGSIISPLVFIMGDLWTPLPFVLFGVSSIIGGLTSLLLPETKGKCLADTIEQEEQSGIEQESATNKYHERIGPTDGPTDVRVQASKDNPGFESDC